MDFIVDANVVIAVLITPGGHTANVFFSPLNSLFAPESLLDEVEKHHEELLKKTGLSALDFKKALLFLTAQIKNPNRSRAAGYSIS